MFADGGLAGVELLCSFGKTFMPVYRCEYLEVPSFYCFSPGEKVFRYYYKNVI